MSLSFFIEPLNARNYRQLMDDGDVGFLRMQPNGRLPTMDELRQVLASFSEFEVEYKDLDDAWQIDMYHREKPSSPLFVFLAVEGRKDLKRIHIVRGAPELYLPIVQQLSEKVGPLILLPRPPLVAATEFGLPYLVRTYKHYFEEIRYWGPPDQLSTRPMKERSVSIGGKPVQLNAGMIDAVVNPPKGFQSKHQFFKCDLIPRIQAISWFKNCGKPFQLDLTMPVRSVASWAEAVKACAKNAWENTEIEANNQLTVFLHVNAHDRYQRWNHLAIEFKKEIIVPLVEKSVDGIREALGLDISIRHSAVWDILGALMENAYLDCGHSALFFLELLTVYEAGHFPCGWEGKWPKGTLLVY